MRKLLLGPDVSIPPRDPSRGVKYADRAAKVMDAVRVVGHHNSEDLQTLYDYAGGMDVFGERAWFSKLRIVDIVLWTEMAIETNRIRMPSGPLGRTTALLPKPDVLHAVSRGFCERRKRGRRNSLPARVGLDALENKKTSRPSRQPPVDLNRY